MRTRLFQFFVFTLFIAVFTAATAGETPASSPTADLRAWAVEQMPGGTVITEAGALVITDVAGSTIWLREKLTVPVVINYDATVVVQGGPRDRLSDLNCFWMASDPRSPQTPPFAPTLARTGKFSDYDSLFTYYVGYGGNENTTTRFRRYGGTSARPLLPEHDLRDQKFLLAPNHTYRIELTALPDGTVRFRRDDELIFEYRDPAPLRSGWFALRTVKSHLVIRNLRITHPPR
ncbi:MAG: hypothetical protein H7343_01325 [Undibacterium sp.]|nr:hypothetical protein [Opitutaceae bacterium]